MPTLLLHTLGNRDLQFHRAIQSKFKDKYLMLNPEDEEFLVIKKGRGEETEYKGSTFHKRSGRIKAWYLDATNHTKEVFKHLCFPIVEKAIDYVLQKEQKIDRLLFCSTLQSPSHKFDTNYIGEIALRFFTEDYTKKEAIKEIKNHSLTIKPTGEGLKKIPRYCLELLERQKQQGFDKIYMSNEAGLPAVTNAFNLVGYFQNYTYLHIHSRKGVSQIYKTEEESILADLVKMKLIRIIQKANF